MRFPSVKTAWKYYMLRSIGSTTPVNIKKLDTAKNALISPNFLVWKLCGKALFPHSSGKFFAVRGFLMFSGEIERHQ